MSKEIIDVGEPVFHPRYGFGVIESMAGDAALHLSDNNREEPVEGYYNIRLTQGGSLFVPVHRAEGLGLRRLENGLAAVQDCLASPAEGLPENGRERLGELRFRSQARQPGALAQAVRDLLHERKGRLTNGEKTWLDNSCERLITEAALVDQIPVAEARAAIRKAVDRLAAASAVVTSTPEQ